jgi:hypothetical protein
VRRARRIATGKAPRWTAFQNTFFNNIERDWSANFNLGGNAFISLPAISERVVLQDLRLSSIKIAGRRLLR